MNNLTDQLVLAGGTAPPETSLRWFLILGIIGGAILILTAGIVLGSSGRRRAKPRWALRAAAVVALLLVAAFGVRSGLFQQTARLNPVDVCSNWRTSGTTETYDACLQGQMAGWPEWPLVVQRVTTPDDLAGEYPVLRQLAPELRVYRPGSDQSVGLTFDYLGADSLRPGDVIAVKAPAMG